MSCFDRDEGRNSVINYKLEGEGSEMLIINPKSGRIMTSQFITDKVERNTAILNITVVATDLGKSIL